MHVNRPVAADPGGLPPQPCNAANSDTGDSKIMATDAQTRAARRTAAAAARRAVRQADVPDAFDPTMADDGPESPVAEAEMPSEPVAPAGPASANLSARRRAQTDVAVPESYRQQGMALPQVDKSREITTRDLVLPRLQIAQSMSKQAQLHAQSRGKEGVQLGNWYHSTTGRDLGEVVYFVPTDMRKSRSKFDTGTGLVCRSYDLVRGEGNPGILCEGTQQEINAGVPEDDRGCEYRLWNRTGGKNIKPPCGLNYNYPGLILVDAENPDKSEMLQAMLTLRSSSTPAALSINTHVMTFGEGVWPNVIIELTTTTQTGPMGSYYVAQADLHDMTDSPGYEKLARRAHALARSMGSADLRSSMEYDPDASA